jgi:hypothetical protein
MPKYKGSLKEKNNSFTLSKCAYEIKNKNQCEKRLYPGLMVLK